jgi:hypothetical protein
MPLPPAHFLVGAGAAELANADRRYPPLRVWIVGGVFGILPDLDKGIGILLGQGGAYRGIFTHTALAVITVLAVVWLIAGRRWGAVAGLAYASHLLLDPLEDRNGGSSAVQPLWPVSDGSVVARDPLLPNVPWQRGEGVEGAAASLLDGDVLPWLLGQTALAALVFALALLLSLVLRRTLIERQTS